MREQLGVGIIGCGSISSTYLSLVPQFAGIKVEAVADINQQAAATRAKQYGVEALEVGELLASKKIDIVLNLTIPEVHVEVTREGLKAGKHVYSEKPLALSVSDAQDLAKLAHKKKLRIGCAPDTFLGGAHQTARRALDEGQAGRIHSGTCFVMSAGMEEWHPNPDFFFRPGGGPILDMGPYYIANLINLLGPIAEVSAMATMAHSFRTIGSGQRAGEKVPVTTPTTVHALLQFVDGAIITLDASWDVLAHRHAHMELYGDKASLFVPDPNFFGGTVELATSGQDLRAVPSQGHPLSVPNQGQGGAKSIANYRGVGLADFARAVGEGAEARCGLEGAVHSVEVLGAIMLAAEERRSVTIKSRCARPEPLGPEQAAALLATTPAGV